MAFPTHPSRFLSTLFILLSLGYGPSGASEAGAISTGRDVVLLLDNSGSMHDHDPDHQIHRALRQFIHQLNPSDRAAIILFDGKVSQIAGLTQANAPGKTEILQALAALNYRGKYTNTAAALEKAIYTLRTQDTASSQNPQHKIILLITDGVVDTGNATRNRENIQWMRNGLADEAARLKIAVYGIAITEAADFQTLQNLAQKTSASYFRAESSSDVKQILSRVLRATNHPARPANPTITAASKGNQNAGSDIKDTEAANLNTPSAPNPAVSLPAAALNVRIQQNESVATNTLAGPTFRRTDPATTPQLRTPAVQSADTGTSPTDLAAQYPKKSTTHPVSAASATATFEPDTISAPTAQPNSPMSTNSNILLLLISFLTVVILAGVFFKLVKNRHNSHEPKPSKPGPARPPAPPSDTAADSVTPASSPPAGTHAVVLHDLSGISGQTEINLNGEVIIGRKAIHPASSLVIPSNTISRQHAQFTYDNNSWWIVDLGSGNGTFVNGKRITSRQPLNEGDIIAFDEYKFRFGDTQFTGNETVIRDSDASSDATIAQLPPEDILASHAATAQLDLSDMMDQTRPSDSPAQATSDDSTNLDLDGFAGNEDPTIAEIPPQNTETANIEEPAFTILPDATPAATDTNPKPDSEAEIDLDFASREEAGQIDQAATIHFHAKDFEAPVSHDQDATIAFSPDPTPPASDSDATIAIPSPATGGKPEK